MSPVLSLGLSLFLSLFLSPPLATAGAAPACDYYAFRDAMAQGKEVEFQALMASCRSEGRWPESDWGSTLLHLAPHVGGPQAAAYVKRLLYAGLSPNAATRDANDPVTPLGMAVRFHCAPCVELLLARGADVRWRGPDGETLLHGAGPATVPLLIAAGLDPAARDAQGNVPLHRSWHPALLGVGVNVTNDAGMTPLHMAALADNLARVDALLAAGADPSIRTLRESRWRSASVSRAFGAGIPVAAGATAYDLAKAQYAASRWSAQSHEATMKRLEAVTPRRGWWGR
ncbi:MAG: hypothetical protein JNJ71_14870 [Rubrivivax sp.]|nr:hypothetical protein [Rubrivivax sp.]